MPGSIIPGSLPIICPAIEPVGGTMFDWATLSITGIYGYDICVCGMP